MLGHNICEVAQNFNILECKKNRLKIVPNTRDEDWKGVMIDWEKFPSLNIVSWSMKIFANGCHHPAREIPKEKYV